MLEEERLRRIAMIHGRIDSVCYHSSVNGSLGKDSSSNINDVVDRVLTKHKKEHKIISKPKKKLPLKKIIPVALISLLLVLSLPYLLPPLFGDFGSDLRVELYPSDGVHLNDTLYVNLTIPSSYNITIVSADMAGVETIDLLFVINDSLVQFWQGVWFVHDLVPGEYLININAIDNANVSYSAGVGLSVLPELISPVFNDSVNDTLQPDVNETIPPVGLNLTLDNDRFVYVVNEIVLISGIVSFNDSLVNTSVNISVFGPNISWVDVLNVSDGLFVIDFVVASVGDFIVNASVVYENLSVSKELSLVVVESSIENISENISEISIVDPQVREELFVLPGSSFYVERTVVGRDGLQAVFAPLFSDGLTLERFEIVGGNVTRGRSREIVSDLPSGVFVSDDSVSGVERRIDNIREHLPSDIKSMSRIGYSGGFVLHEPVTVRVWFRAPGWDDIISGRVPGSGRISYLTFAGDDFDFESSTWWNSNWYNRKLITINSSQVETDLINFPILINITDTDLRDDAQDDGDDIAFILYSDDSTKLNHEIEMFNGSTGQLYAWVNITNLSSSVDTKMWMYYNNSGCTSQENIHGVWDSNFIGVWHFEESSGVAEDSTSNELNGSFNGNLPDAKSSQIYLGQDFDGADDYIEVTDPGTGSILDFNYGDDITISVWIKPTALPSYGCILEKDPYEDMNYGLQNVGQQLNIFYRDSADTYYPEYLTTENVLSTGTWYYATATYTFGTGSTAKIYIDGNERLASWNVGNGNDAPLLSNNPLWFGADDIGSPGSPDEEFNGIIDEVRISNIIRNSSWITTSYNTMKNHSTFINIESEEYITNTSVNSISPYIVTYSPFTITATGSSGLDNVTLYYRYSTDNSSWGSNVSWYNESNPDNESPWEWSFNFSNGTGYYEFYSISMKSGSPDELVPANADAICYFNESLNTLPEITLINPQPNGTTGVSLLPMCQIWANDSDGDTLTVYWYENTSGSWVLRNTNNSVSANTIVSYNFTQFSNYSITYWWKVAINDSNDNISSWFYFTTEPIITSVDTIDPYDQSTFSLTINSTGSSNWDNVTLYYRWSEDNRSWGVGIQNISIYEGFESGSMNTSLWDVYSSTAYGQNVVNNTNPNTGSYSWFMASNIQNNYNLNELYTVYDFTGATNINIDFWQYDSTDEETDAPASWNDHYDADAVAFTNDGTTWYEIIDAATLNINGLWTHFTYNISSHPNFDPNVTSNFAIKFQQYDNWIYPNDGRLWDDVYINFTLGGNGINWTLWNDANNPDNSYPWSWNFDFPNQTGYYEFYSIGKKSGEIDEDPPSFADAICYNNPTTMVDPIIPYNQTTSPLTITATGESGFENVTLYYRYSQDNITWVMGSGDIIWSSELLTNPGFETGDTTGWSNSGGGTMTVGTDCPYGSQSPDGTYYAYWLQNNWIVNSYAYQNVSLDSYASYIDVGLAKINVTGWLVSDEYNVPVYDEFFMNVKFYNASDVNISDCWYESGGTNPVSQGSGNNVGSWAQYGITNYTIPVGARKVQITFFCWEYNPIGPVYWDSGSAENFSVTVGIEDYNWTEFGTDTNYPWSWEFNFPNNTGYYEFYTVGNKSGWPNETKPDNADAMCKYNNQPTISNEVPSNESTGISLTPQMNITINDPDGDSMTITWYSNSSGTWQVFGINSSAVNGTYYQTNANYTSTGKTYWWYVRVNDGIDTNSSAIFHFTTTDIAPPQVTSNSSTGVEETNATLWGYLYDEGGESCTARFEYGITTSYGTNTTNQTISEGEEFSAEINSLTPGQIYHYRAYANNTYGSDTGSDITFLTKPQPPTSFTAQANNSSTIYLTWTVGTGANTTYIERNTSSSWALGEATEIYNGSAAFYEDTGLTQGTTYYYQAWSYSTWIEISTFFKWSDTNASDSNTTNNRPTCTVISPINASTNVNLQPICEIWANDTDGDLLTVDWYENTTGSWLPRQTNTSVEANSTLNWTFTQANAYGTTYCWKITINDSIDNTTFLYYFTTIKINTSVDTISPYVVSTSPFAITATNTTQVDNITLYYRWSNDNITWSIPIPGMITDSVISEYEWDAQEGRQPVVCRVNSSEYYLIATAGDTGTDNDGWARVIRVYNNNGSIQQSVISSYEFDDSDGNYPSIVHLPGTDKYAISYRDTTGDRVKVVTLQVSDITGIITQPYIDVQSLTYDGLYTNMILVSPDEPFRSGWIFAVAYQEGGTGGAAATNDGFMETIWIDNTGTINNTIMSTREFDIADCVQPILVIVDADTVAICYTTSGSDGYISAWNITSSGIIGTTMADGWEYDTTNGQYPGFIKISGNVYAVAYRDTDTFGYVITFNISDTGMITKTFVDSLTFTGTMVNLNNSIFPIVQGSVYGISFQGLDADGYIYTMNISSDGVIGNAIIDSIEFDTADNAYFANVINLNSSYYLVVYQGSGSDGWAKTVGISNDLGWMKWENVSNPDNNSPWSWNFNFPNGTGYYEFYSIGKKSGSTDESPPESADATCVFNRLPTITNEVPNNASTNIQLIPQLSISVNDIDGDGMNITWYSNSSGSWQIFGVNNSISNGTYYQTNSNFSSPGITYWWNVSVYDGVNTNNSGIFHFTTSYQPVISNPGPSNNSNTHYTTPVCNITVSDIDGGSVTIRFYENITGSWVLQQTNNSVDVTNPSNVIWNNYSNATQEYTTYWWKVNVSDGKGCYAEEIYHFTTANTSIEVTPSRWDQGVLIVGSSNETTGFYFNLTNNGDVPLYIQIKASNATNATTGAKWVLNATPSYDNFTLQYNKSGGGTWTAINLTYDLFISNLGIGAWQTFDLKLIMATMSSTSDPLSMDLTFRSIKA